MALGDTTVYSLRLDKTIKTQLQEYFTAAGGDLAAGLRKVIYDFYSEIVPPRPAGSAEAIRENGGADSAPSNTEWLEPLSAAVADVLRSHLPATARITISPPISLTFGEYVRAFPPREVLVAFLTTTVGSETVMVDLSHNFYDLLRPRTARRSRSDIESELRRLLEFAILPPQQTEEIEFKVLHVETNLDHCRFTSFLEPIVQQTLHIMTPQGIATATLTLPARAHRVI